MRLVANLEPDDTRPRQLTPAGLGDSYAAICKSGILFPMRLPIAALLFILAGSSAHADTIAGRASVIDGDTIEIDGERIRILDIDAPESRQFCFKKLQGLDEGAWPCGQQAALALSDWIGEQTVTCETTRKETAGLYQHWLARCAVADQDMAEWLAANGWAVRYRDCKCDVIRDAAHNARAAQLGIWTSAFTLPWDWRKAH
jgi:endonuclease YncB( thermonuclease family)